MDKIPLSQAVDLLKCSSAIFWSEYYFLARADVKELTGNGDNVFLELFSVGEDASIAAEFKEKDNEVVEIGSFDMYLVDNQKRRVNLILLELMKLNKFSSKNQSVK